MAKPKGFQMDKKQKNLMPVALETLIILWLAWLASCQKEPIPEPVPDHPNVPTDTITPVIPGDTLTPTPGDTLIPTPGDTIVPTPPTPGDTLIPGGDTLTPVPGGKVVNFCTDGADMPPLDSIRRYAYDPTYDSIYIIWMPCGQDYWTPIGFHITRDSLRKRFDISPKVYGRSWIRPYQILPDADSTNISVKGMIQNDRDWYESKHYIVWPVVGDKGKKPQQPQRYNGTMVLPRNNCRGGRVRGR